MSILSPPSFAPSLFQGQFISGSLLMCEVTKARDRTGRSGSPWTRGHPRLHLHSSPAHRRCTAFPPVPTLLLREAARLRLRRTRPVAAFPAFARRGRDARGWRSCWVLSLIVMIRTRQPRCPTISASAEIPFACPLTAPASSCWASPHVGVVIQSSFHRQVT